MSELRHNRLTGEWVVIAGERAARPRAFSEKEASQRATTSAECPFCAGNEAQTPPEIYAVRDGQKAADGPGWRVRVVPNKYPAFAAAVPPKREDDLLPGYGAHEVIIHSPDHSQNLAEMPVEKAVEIFTVYQRRIETLRRDRNLASSIIIINKGKEAGASIEHPHSQLFALPIPIPAVEAERLRLSAYRAEKQKCLLCDMVESERAAGVRLVVENRDFAVLCPYASRVPFELIVVGKEHQADFSQAGQDQLAALGEVLTGSLKQLKAQLGDPAYNLYLHTRPFRSDGDYHWHVSVLPKLSIVAGFELGSGVFINVTDPDDAAKRLRPTL